MMQLSRRTLVAATMLAVLGPALPAMASEQERLVERAKLALEEFLADSNFDKMRIYVQNAQAVMIFPELLKAGLIVGVEAGSGIMVVRDEASGSWSNPAFYRVYEGSFGLQIGGAATAVVLTIMNRPAIDKILTSKFQMGTDASVAAGPVGPGVGASTTTNFGEDIYTFSRSKGLFAGLTLSGAAVLPNADWNQAYYGVQTSPARILRGEVQGGGPEVTALKETLARF